MKMKIIKSAGSNRSVMLLDVPKKKPFKWTQPLTVLCSLIFIWILAPGLIRLADDTAGSIDQSIWLLVLLSLICFMLITGFSWWLLQRFWILCGLPSLSFMVAHFHLLTAWQRICLLWASFALLLLASLGTLFALC